MWVRRRVREWWAWMKDWVWAGGGEEKAKENWVRGNWYRDWEASAVTFGTVVGMGNVWGFPFLIYRYGSAFLIPYLLLYIMVGIPGFILEQSVGQFTSRGPGHYYRFLLPAAEGVGWTHLYSAILFAANYNTVNAYNLFYLITNLMDPPFNKCKSSRANLAGWASQSCTTYREYKACVGGNASEHLWAYGACYDNQNIHQFHSHLLPLYPTLMGSHLCSRLFEALRDCVSDRSADINDGHFHHDCGIILSLSLQNNSPASIFFGSPDDVQCAKPLFQRKTSCGTDYTDYAIPLKDWQKVQSGHFRIPLGTGMGVCMGSTDRQRLQDRQSCLRQVFSLPGAAASPIWPQIRAFCDHTKSRKISNVACARSIVSFSQTLASRQYFKYNLNAGDMADFGSLGWNTQMLLCYGGAWLILMCTSVAGPRFIPRFFPLTVVFPVLTLLFLFFMGISLENSGAGIGKLFRFDACILSSAAVWSAALREVTYTLSLGGLIATCSSYSRFHSNLPMVTVWVVSADLSFAFLATFAMLGMDMDIMGFLRGGSLSIGYQAMAELIAEGRGFELLGVPYYGMLLVLGVLNHSIIMEIIFTWALDTWTWLRFLRSGIVCIFCLFVGLCTFPMVGRAGNCVFHLLLDINYEHVIPLNLVASTFLLAWVRGPRNLLNDFRLMAKPSSGRLITLCFDSPFRYVLGGLWVLLPMATMVILISTWMDVAGKMSGPRALIPSLQMVLGLGVWVGMVLGGMVKAWRAKGWTRMWRVSADWGPVLDVHRQDTPYEGVGGSRTTAEARGLGMGAPDFLRRHLYYAQSREEVKGKVSESGMGGSSAGFTGSIPSLHSNPTPPASDITPSTPDTADETFIP